MEQNLNLCDEYGIIYEAMKILPSDELKIDFLEALAELDPRGSTIGLNKCVLENTIT